MAQTYRELIFASTQEILQLPNEHFGDLHERLRLRAVNSFVSVREPSKIVTPSWYTFDASRVLTDVVDAVAVCTSTCKHEMPYQILVGRRKEGWQKQHPTISDKFVYELHDLGRNLTETEKNHIY